MKVLNKCDILKQYCEFVEKVRELKDEKSANPITEAISYCIENNILKEYLKRKSTEVNNLLVANYDYETDIRVHAEEAAEEAAKKAYAEGNTEGENKRARETALRMLKDGIPIEKVADYTGLTIENVTKLQKVMPV